VIRPHVHQPALIVARRAELLSKIGDDHVFPNIDTAVSWARRDTQGLDPDVRLPAD
jgi:hypothetical protein